MHFSNKLIENDLYTTPPIKNVLNQTAKKKYFTVVDMEDGYSQTKLKLKDRHKTAFFFKNKLCQWTRMPQEFKNSSAVFQRIIDQVLVELKSKVCEVYPDEIAIYGETEAKRDENVKTVFRKVEEKNF